MIMFEFILFGAFFLHFSLEKLGDKDVERGQFVVLRAALSSFSTADLQPLVVSGKAAASRRDHHCSFLLSALLSEIR